MEEVVERKYFAKFLKGCSVSYIHDPDKKTDYYTEFNYEDGDYPYNAVQVGIKVDRLSMEMGYVLNYKFRTFDDNDKYKEFKYAYEVPTTDMHSIVDYINQAVIKGLELLDTCL